MACPDCEHRFREYLIFRGAVARFGQMLEQLEVERERILDELRPPGVPPLAKVEARLGDGPPQVAKRSRRKAKEATAPADAGSARGPAPARSSRQLMASSGREPAIRRLPPIS